MKNLDFMGLPPSSSLYQTSDCGQVTSLLWSSVSSCEKGIRIPPAFLNWWESNAVVIFKRPEDALAVGLIMVHGEPGLGSRVWLLHKSAL